MAVFTFLLTAFYRLSGVCRRSGTDGCRTHRDVSGTVPFRCVTEQVQRDIGRPSSAAASHAQVFFRVSYFKSSEWCLSALKLPLIIFSYKLNFNKQSLGTRINRNLVDRNILFNTKPEYFCYLQSSCDLSCYYV